MNFVKAILALNPTGKRDAVAVPNGLANLHAILADQPYGNSALSVTQIATILENKGGFMPDEAIMWFREWSVRTVAEACPKQIEAVAPAAEVTGERATLREILTAVLGWYKSDVFLPTVDGRKPARDAEVTIGPITKALFDKVEAALSTPSPDAVRPSMKEGWQLVPKKLLNEIIERLSHFGNAVASGDIGWLQFPVSEFHKTGDVLDRLNAALAAAPQPTDKEERS